MRIVWDEPKRLRNLAIHGLDFADIDRFDWNDAVVFRSYDGSRGEPRYVAVGPLDDDIVTCVFARLGVEAISVISLRRASRKERHLHGQGQTKDH